MAHGTVGAVPPPALAVGGAAPWFHDAARRLRYRGRLADSRQPATATRHDLADALEDLAAGRPVRLPDAPAMGCSIVW